jgi:aryl-alcohol dehydrogenase-like predicted oxidoreductase
MRTVPLGDTGVSVSALCLGAMYFGTKNDQAASEALLDQYVGSGGTFIDSANIYAWWVPGFRGRESEAVLARWMRARRNRANLFIATKVGFDFPGVARGLRAAQIEAECEKSLQTLGTDCIDLYYAHADDRSTPMEETLAAFDRLVRAGKVRFIGASNFTAWRLEEARWTSQNHAWNAYCCVQQRYSYLRPRPGTTFEPQLAVNADLLDYCRVRPLTVLAYSVLLGGAYTRPDRVIPEQYVGPDSEARLAVLRAIAAEKGVSPNQIILAWMLHGDPPVLPLIAASTQEDLQQNLAALEIHLTPAEMERLNHAGA